MKRIYLIAFFSLVAFNSRAQDLKKLSKEYIEAYFALDRETLKDYLAEDVHWSDPTWKEVDPASVPISGRQEMLTHLKKATNGIEKMNYAIDSHFVSGNIAVFEGVLSYTWKDDRSGKSYDFKMREVSVLEFNQGKIIKHTDYTDFKAWLAQYQKQQG